MMTLRILSAVTVLATAQAVVAQDESDEAEKTEKTAEAAETAPAAKAEPTRVFTSLPFCQRADGIAEVMIPGKQGWSAVEEGRFYPLGSEYRTRGRNSKLVIVFGEQAKAVIENDAAFGTKVQPLGEQTRTVIVRGGVLNLDLDRKLPEGLFLVTAPGFTIKNVAGQSMIDYRTLPDGDEVVVRCVTGVLGLSGRHFDIPKMRVADEIRIRSTVDNLQTFLYGNSGDYIVRIDRGIVTRNDVDEEGKVKPVAEKAFLAWHLSPKTKVRIDRMVPAIGERMSVAVMTFDAVGELKNNFAYSEGRAEVNSGELVVSTVDDSAKAAKKAGDAAEEKKTEPAEDEKADDSEKEKSEDDSEKATNKKEEE